MYPSWRSAFSALIDNHNIPNEQRIHYLKRYLGGDAEACVTSFLLIPTGESYKEALSLIDKRFGNPFVIANAFKAKLEAWPKIGVRDAIALRKFTDFLRQCEVASRSNVSLKVLDDDMYNRLLLTKLPDWLVTRWSREVHRVKQQQQRYPKFCEFVQFVCTEADIAADPVTSLHRPIDIKSKTNCNVAPIGKVLNTVQSPCLYCQNTNHELQKCFKFKAISHEAKQIFIKEKGICFGCLTCGHLSRTCNKRLKCDVCQKRHPTILHDSNFEAKLLDKQTNSNVAKQTNSNIAKSSKSGGGAKVEQQNGQKADNNSKQKHTTLLTCEDKASKSTMVLPVYISHFENSNKQVLTYALLDTQSDTTFVTDHVLSQLGVSGTDTILCLSTMTSDSSRVHCKRVCGLSVRGYNCEIDIALPQAYSQENIPSCDDSIPVPQMAKKWPYLQPMVGNLMPKINCGIGLLIGYNCSRALVPRDVIPPVGNGPYAQRTDLGWGIVGLVDDVGTPHVCSDKSGSRIVHRTSAKEVISPSEIIKFFGREEGFDDHKTFSFDDMKFMNMMNMSVCKVNDHYEMPLPFKDPNDLPENNKVIATQRLQGLVKRFKKDPDHHARYCKFMSDVIDQGHAELVPQEELGPGTKAHYLPHHGVYNPAKPGKIRVVMDASSKFKGKSLNDCLLTGPDLMNSLIGVLCRFRREFVAFSCDIKGMFYQFQVRPCDRNWLRFLWFKDGDYNNEILTYRSTVHLFGAASSPAVANFGLKQAAVDGEQKHGTEVRQFIENEFYVDDGLTSVPSIAEAINLVKGSIALCASSGLTLHKFVSNSREVLQAINKEYHADAVKDLNLCHDSLPIERALGVSWCVESDSFKFRVIVNPKPLTRRGLLSTVCSIFDPLGLIAPVVLQGKILLQSLCRDKVDWDEPLPEDISRKWQLWLMELPSLESASVQRCYKPAEFGEVKKWELHSFSDASQDGYGQCSYLRLVDANNNVHCSLVMGKSRVTPLKVVTIPRLELTAAVLSVEVSHLLSKELKYPMLQHFFWTDSQIVLSYIGNDAKRFQVYVANRIQRIRDGSKLEQWQHVSSVNNPADLASRGATAQQLLDSSWLHGPAFLWDLDPSSGGECGPFDLDLSSSEIKKEAKCLLVKDEDIFLPIKYSSWNHARRVVAVCLKFIKNLKMKKKSDIEVDDIIAAEKLLIKQTQLSSFKDEVNQLRLKQNVKVNNRLNRLDPFLDNNGLIRVGGRVKDATMPFEIKHPLILPKDHFITRLIVSHYHEKSCHQGKGITMNAIRSQGLWVVGLGNMVSSVIHKCVVCRRYRSAPLGQKMGNLPEDRLEPGPAFTHVGVDYFGPFFITERRREIKRYGVLFTCLTSRAIHLETAPSLDTDAFINALRRFLSIRGPMRTLRCDQGSNFVGGINQLQNAISLVDNEAVKQFLLENSCDYLFNPPHASHQGGVWERQIRSVRSVLNVLLGSNGHQLDDDGLRTLMYEVANIVNSRPLSAVGDPSSPIPLSPNMLLTMKSNVVLPPPGEFCDSDVYSRKRWRRVQHLANAFWERWKKEFVIQLQQRKKWTQSQRNLQIGDIVLLIDESLPRCQWKLGKVTEVFPGSDKLVRKVKLVVGNPNLQSKGNQLKTLERPIHKLILVLENEQN